MVLLVLVVLAVPMCGYAARMTSGIRDGLALLCVAAIAFLLAVAIADETASAAAGAVGGLLAIVGLAVIAFSLVRRPDDA